MSRRVKAESKQQVAYINEVISALKDDPRKLDIIRKNLDFYREQSFLKRGFLLAIERFDWVFEASNGVDEVCAQIIADDYIGKRLRRYPLLYKGVINRT
ncbi:hypothetical protein [Pseudoalteromonas lipolytica]|uniref:Uncharacterized protein n=1 Tax=Pseudoalteromonas lipolytica TaxID=570156 RepID=A0ABY1GEI0_9GAMM|nr:hypothetical protein [Pseudoalteromonas lipolytica]MBE0353018.1 hypothetical protein [Pseudoalteromonas lipolytica LMEB 39]SFT53898.1 hypothetical protein SAMN04487854_104165 [Pseudoalteromonas lipolytica]